MSFELRPSPAPARTLDLHRRINRPNVPVRGDGETLPPKNAPFSAPFCNFQEQYVSLKHVKFFKRLFTCRILQDFLPRVSPLEARMQSAKCAAGLRSVFDVTSDRQCHVNALNVKNGREPVRQNTVKIPGLFKQCDMNDSSEGFADSSSS